MLRESNGVSIRLNDYILITIRVSRPGPLVLQACYMNRGSEENKYWLVGFLGFNGPFRQHFSLYRAVCQREGV